MSSFFFCHKENITYYNCFRKVYSYPPNLWYNLQQFNLNYTHVYRSYGWYILFFINQETQKNTFSLNLKIWRKNKYILKFFMRKFKHIFHPILGLGVFYSTQCAGVTSFHIIFFSRKIFWFLQCEMVKWDNFSTKQGYHKESSWEVLRPA